MILALRILSDRRSRNETPRGRDHHSQGPSALGCLRLGHLARFAQCSPYALCRPCDKSRSEAGLPHYRRNARTLCARRGLRGTALPLELAPDPEQPPRGFEEGHPSAEVQRVSIAHHRIRLGPISSQRPPLQLRHTDSPGLRWSCPKASVSAANLLRISLNAACSAAFSDEAAMVYELDVTAADQATKEAIGSALRGDWTGISGLPNARKIRDVITETVEKKYSLSVNVLGLYNYRAVEDFMRSVQVIKNRADGSVVITDSLTAKQIVTASLPLAADPDRLRSALFEAFFATATYKALGAGVGVAPSFKASQDFLLYADSMGFHDALKQVNAGEVLGIMPIAKKTELSAHPGPIHHARFAASCTYDNDHVLRFFFSDAQGFKPRTLPDLKKTGRNVLAALLDPQDTTDQKRIGALKSDEAWADIDAHPAQILPPFYSDWTLITWWASAIASVGALLADTIQYAKTVTGDPTLNGKFMKKRADLALALDEVTHKTQAVFEKAFPICVMATLAGLTPGANPPPPVFEAAWNGKTQFSNKPAAQVTAAKALR